MNSPSIEFDRIKEDSTLPKIIRKSFRVPVEDSKDVWVRVNKKQYPVLDICIDGISLAIDDPSVFSVEQSLLNCELSVFNESIKNLNGSIVHFSDGMGEDWKFGIQWLGMEKEAADQISKIVLKMKEQLLIQNSISLDEE